MVDADNKENNIKKGMGKLPTVGGKDTSLGNTE